MAFAGRPLDPLAGDARFAGQAREDGGTRANAVAKDGWGAQLLALQSTDGRWAGGLYTPKWTSTTYTMVLLRGLGLPAGNPQAIRACGLLMDAGFWTDGGINFWSPRCKSSETCVSSLILAVMCHFRFSDERVDPVWP